MENFFQAHCLFREIVSRKTLLGELADGGRGALLEDILKPGFRNINKEPLRFGEVLAGWTRLELVTSGVTGRCSNQN